MAPESQDESGFARAPASTNEADDEEGARELLRTAGHDLRSPLSVIELLVQRVEWRRQSGSEPSGAEWRETLAGISRAAKHALALVEELLSAGRLDPRKSTRVRSESPIDVEDVISEAILLQREALDRARCAVTVTRKSGLERALGAWNRASLLRIFSNLLQNASKYAPAAPVHVQLARTGDRLRIVFADRGPGLPVRGDRAAGKYFDDGIAPTGPHGLGLWIVRRGVAELNGSLKIRNAPGMGLALTIEIPGLRV